MRFKAEYRQQVLSDLRALDSSLRKIALGYMREIESDPLKIAPNRVALPPMHVPGTMDAFYGQLAIRYFVRRDDQGDAIVFLRIRLR